MKKVIFTFITWRILLFLPLLSFLFLNYRTGYDYTNIWKFTSFYFPVSNPFIFPWANFDGVHYLSIAANGYSHDLGFFPLYPILIKALSLMIEGHKPFDLGYFISGFFISNIASFTSIVILYKLLKIDYSKKVAYESIIFLLLFPTSFFLGSIYTEGLFLLLTLLSFYFARKKKWVLSALFATLLCATRLVGIAILPALLYEYLQQEEKIKSKNFAALLLIPIGLISYVFYNYWKFANPLLFIQAHADINPTRSVNHIVLFPQTVFRYLKILLTTYGNFEWWIALLELSSFVFVSIMLYIAWKKKIRTSYLIFSLLAFIIPISSGTFTGLPRYVLVLFPIFASIALANNKALKILYIGLSIILLIVLTALFSRGYFVA